MLQSVFNLLRFLFILTVFLISAPVVVTATNGMNMIGYGAVSSAMGGADLALVDNATAMNINPAGLSGCCDPQLSAGISLMFSRNHHNDTHGNDLQATEQVFPVPLLALAQPLRDSGFIVGFGFFAQGGMGVEYKDFRVPFADFIDLENEYDTISSDVRYMKITPTLAWQNREDSLRVGASLNLGYAETEMQLFPHTSIAENQFFGIDMQGCEAYSAAIRLGFQYQIGRVRIGGAYLSATHHSFKHGTSILNYTSLGHGMQRYDTELDGFNWPRQIGVGFSYQITSRLKFAFDLDWVNWSDAIDSIKFNLKQNASAAVPADIHMEYPMHWDDQWVYACGLEYGLSPAWTLRVGYNFARSPVPAHHLLPYFPAIAEHHVTGGFTFSAKSWSLDVACEWALNNRVSSTNSLYCSHGFSEEMSQFTTHFMFNYKL
jgi:long-chain fatty acid transport protein